MEDIIIYGAGGLGRETLILIKAVNHVKPSWDVRGFFDDNPNFSGDIDGYPFLGTPSQYVPKRQTAIVFAVGDTGVKRSLFEEFNWQNYYFPTIIHPSATIGHKVSLGQGCLIMAGCHLTTNIRLGDFVILNLNCTIGHDSEIGDYCSIMPGVNISGEVVIDHSVYVGTGASIINQVSIGSESTLGAGCVVIDDIASGSTAVGVPSKTIKNKHER